MGLPVETVPSDLLSDRRWLLKSLIRFGSSITPAGTVYGNKSGRPPDILRKLAGD